MHNFEVKYQFASSLSGPRDYENGKIMVDDLFVKENHNPYFGIPYFLSEEAAYDYFFMPISGIKKYYDRNGILTLEHECQRGRMHGKYVEYYDDGKIKIECSYQDGALHGEYKEFYENGKKHKKCVYDNGLYNGMCEIWDCNGRLLVKIDIKSPLDVIKMYLKERWGYFVTNTGGI